MTQKEKITRLEECLDIYDRELWALEESILKQLFALRMKISVKSHPTRTRKVMIQAKQ